MSLACVRQGATDPREIKKLIDRGVNVFSRGRLHSKVFVLGGAAIVGSTNVSSNSMDWLEEAAVLSTNTGVVAAAVKYVESLATEPVNPGYLEACLAEYRPPRFKAFVPVRSGAESSPHGKGNARLWFLSGLAEIEVPESELDSVTRIEESAKKLRSRSTYRVEQIFDRSPRIFAPDAKGD
ncbi:MAG: hypothetical protein IPP98_09275 [Gemmatimonadetes bacterium]|nr:hypothetical protein [Gemmatimonadota bacterium]